ncbi:hypothetical protein [Streptomyces zagrosensis]|uniref:FtsK domain-containing protein n=1 Tax=Streptomyces zagrosensis TaxID=1042984 RepID=A0A7W9QFR7_9ACTN|nr:hypothetical protein [Streptomyces zagrosensis]MBB5938382.1 hypothetical protein [Streptomyces zagrosensis]
MARLTLTRALTGNASLVRGRELARTVADNASDVLHPLLVILRGLRVLAAAGRRRWVQTPQERRGPTLFLVAACAFAIAMAPFGPLLALIGLMSAAAWAGRDRSPARGGSRGPEAERLRTLYEALVPCFTVADDPDPLYGYAGEWQKAFEEYDVEDGGRLTRLVLRYPAYFADGEATARGQVERLLAAKCGRGREYRFDWDEEANRLVLSVLPALPTVICAQRFVTTPGETVLGFTDPDAVRRTLPVIDAAGQAGQDAPPVVWRTGARSTEPHLLALGQPGSGTTTLLRSLVLQALPHSDVLVVDGAGSGGYAYLHDCPGVLAVESELIGALAALEWAVHETERRLLCAHQARRLGQPAPDDVRRALWIVLDQPATLSHLAAAEGRPDPQELLRVPLRHGRPANVTVAIADQLDSVDALSTCIASHTRARVVLGPASYEQLHGALGAPPHTSPTPEVPPGRGYARLGCGPVHRLQVPATPDPYDDATSEAQRMAVLALLPGSPFAIDTTDATTPNQRTELTEPAGRAEPAEPVGRAAPAEPVRPPAPTRQAEPAAPVAPVRPATPAAPDEPMGPVGPVGPQHVLGPEAGVPWPTPAA